MSAPFRDLITIDGDGHPVVAYVAGPRPGTAPVVVAAHGITANALSFLWLAHALPEVTVVALDLRGRGQSAAHPGPYGMAAHARDAVAALDFVGGDTAIAVGHSMGAFVVSAAAVLAPERWRHVVLVDGGPALPAPAGVDPDAVIDLAVGPAIARLSMRWCDRDDALRFWKAHPSLAQWEPWLDAFVDHDLVGTDEGTLRSRVNEAAIRHDGRELVVDEAIRGAAAAVDVALTLLRARRGMLDDPTNPLISDAALAAFSAAAPAAEIVALPPELNHYTAAMSHAGAAAIAATVRAALASSR